MTRLKTVCRRLRQCRPWVDAHEYLVNRTDGGAICQAKCAATFDGAWQMVVNCAACDKRPSFPRLFSSAAIYPFSSANFISPTDGQHLRRGRSCSGSCVAPRPTLCMSSWISSCNLVAMMNMRLSAVICSTSLQGQLETTSASQLTII